MKSYAIADIDALPNELLFFQCVSEICAAGVDFIQLRAKRLEGRDMMRIAQRCREIIPTQGPRFLINGRADVAIAAGADGVHLPSDGIPPAAVRSVSESLLVGRSCHSLADAAAALSDGADYILFGPVFSPRSKRGRSEVAPGDLQAVAASLPTFALGGISLQNLPRLKGLGLEGVAAVTLFMIDRPLERVVESVRQM